MVDRRECVYCVFIPLKPGGRGRFSCTHPNKEYADQLDELFFCSHGNLSGGPGGGVIEKRCKGHSLEKTVYHEQQELESS